MGLNYVSALGSIIARSGSKRLPYKNLLPYKGVPLVRKAVIQLVESNLFDKVVLSTDSELIARTCMDIKDLSIIKRPAELATDEVASIPVFQHIVQNFPCDLHLNYNCNFPECPNEVFERAIELAQQTGESLSVPYAVWAQTNSCLKNYGDPFKITAKTFDSKNIFPIDIHTMTDLIEMHRVNQAPFDW